MAASRPYLRHGLDKEVFQVVTRMLERDDTPDVLDVSTVYEYIRRSNSSLKRKGKPLLEDSIERALARIQADQDEEDSDPDNLPQEDIAVPEEADASNAMNRSILKSMKKRAAKEAANTSQEIPTPETNGINGDTSSKKRRDVVSDASKERPAKRSKWRDAPNTDPPTHISLADFGGMEHVIADFREYIMLPLLKPELYSDAGIKIPRGVLLHGPPGCGKTMISEAVAAELGLPFLKISAPSVVSGMSGESEKQLRQLFEHAVSLAPCLMFIDEIDAITPKRESAAREMERRIVAQLLTCLDDLDLSKTGGKPVIVLAATNRPDSLDSALRRGGRFDKEINVGIPTARVREQILRAQTRNSKIAPDVDFALLAKRTPGFVGADLESLTFKAGAAFITRYLNALDEMASREVVLPVQSTTLLPLDASSDIDMDNPNNASGNIPAPQPISESALSFRKLRQLLLSTPSTTTPASILASSPDSDAITMADFLAALPSVQPSSKREGFATIPDTTWSNIGALTSVRSQLQDAVVEPIRRPERYERLGFAAPAGVLLWGPPGCGKTLLAKAVAHESQANFISVKGPELLNKYVGESERAVRQLFFRARSSTPCVIFFDELDALVPKRDAALTEASSRVVNTLLTELDGLSERAGIYVIAATNRPDTIDPAMLRPGRLGKHLFVGLPGPNERVDILRTILRSKPVRDEAERERMAEIARDCERFSGADLANLVFEGALVALKADADFLEPQHLVLAREGLRPSIGEADLKEYGEWKLKM